MFLCSFSCYEDLHNMFLCRKTCYGDAKQPDLVSNRAVCCFPIWTKDRKTGASLPSGRLDISDVIEIFA